MYLQSLPAELLREIINYSIDVVLLIGQCSKDFQRIASDETYWRERLLRDYFDPSISTTNNEKSYKERYRDLHCSRSKCRTLEMVTTPDQLHWMVRMGERLDREIIIKNVDEPRGNSLVGTISITFGDPIFYFSLKGNNEVVRELLYVYGLDPFYSDGIYRCAVKRLANQLLGCGRNDREKVGNCIVTVFIRASEMVGSDEERKSSLLISLGEFIPYHRITTGDLGKILENIGRIPERNHVKCGFLDAICYNKNSELLKLLIRKGFDVTDLHRRNNVYRGEILRILIENGYRLVHLTDWGGFGYSLNSLLEYGRRCELSSLRVVFDYMEKMHGHQKNLWHHQLCFTILRSAFCKESTINFLCERGLEEVFQADHREKKRRVNLRLKKD